MFEQPPRDLHMPCSRPSRRPGRPAVHHRRLIVTGGVTALGLATALALAAPSAAGAQAQGQHKKVTVIADHLNNPRGLAAALGSRLFFTCWGRGGSAWV